MSRGKPTLFDEVSEAASGAGSEALAAISNFGGGDAGGTVGRLVSAVVGRHGGFAPKVITSVTKHGIAGIERVEPLEGVDRGYRAVAADANGLESIRTIVELDPREYDVTVTREAGAGVVEFVQRPDPEPERATVEPSPPVAGPEVGDGADPGGRARASADRRAGASAMGTRERRRDEVAAARAEAEKAKAEAEAEKARAEAETARAEAEAAKARARTERARAESDAGVRRGGRTAERDGEGGSPEASLPRRATEPAPGTASERNGSRARNATNDRNAPGATDTSRGRTDARTADTVEQSATGAAGGSPAAVAGGSEAGGAADSTEGKWGLADAGASPTGSATTVDPGGEAGGGSNAPLRTAAPLEAGPVDRSGSAASGDEASTTVVEDGFGSFVAADPVEDAGSGDDDARADGSTADDGIGRWAGDGVGGTGGFEF